MILVLTKKEPAASGAENGSQVIVTQIPAHAQLCDHFRLALQIVATADLRVHRTFQDLLHSLKHFGKHFFLSFFLQLLDNTQG